MIYLVKVSGLNKSMVMGDTNDLSTIRGGSVAFLEVMNKLDTSLGQAGFAAYELIYKGASQLFAKIECEGGNLKEQIENLIDKSCTLRAQLQFTVSVAEAADWKNALVLLNKQAALAKMKRLSFVMPQALGIEVCYYDRMRPATRLVKEKPASDFTYARHRFGRWLRPNIYFHKVIGIDKNFIPEDVTFSQSLTDLAEKSLSPALQGKIALIHVDGNRFGEKRNKIINGAKVLDDYIKKTSDFSGKILKKHKEIMQALLDYCLSRSETMIFYPTGEEESRKFDKNTDPCLRLETLLWGGDEFVIAVPVFAAWEMVTCIHNTLKDFDLNYGIGLAFAHHKTPIRALKNIAEELVQEAKETDNTKNCVSVFASESVDLPVGGLGAVRKKLFETQQNLAFIDFKEATAWLIEFKAKIPKSQAMKTLHDFEAREENFQRLYGKESAVALLELLSPKGVFKTGYMPKLPLLTALHLWDYVDV